MAPNNDETRLGIENTQPTASTDPAATMQTPEEALAQQNIGALDETLMQNVDALLASFHQEAAEAQDLHLMGDHPAVSQESAPAEEPTKEQEAEAPAEPAPEEPSAVDTAPVPEGQEQAAAESAGDAPAEEPKPEAAGSAEEAPPPEEQPAETASGSNLKAEEYLIDTPAYMGLEGNTPRKKRRKRHPHFLYYIAEAFRGIFAHGFMSFAAVGIITACLLIMGTFSLVALNVDSQINKLMASNEFLAYVDENFTTDQAQALQSSIEAIENVSEVTFITREEAYDSYVDQVDDSELYADLDPNTIFRDRFSVKVTDLEQIQATSDQVGAIEGIVKISIDTDLAEAFITARNIVVLVAVVLVAILFIISLFIISNTIKLVTISRKDEIAVMRMVGATNRFIRWPFIYQGAVLGLLGAGIAYGLETGLYIGVCDAIAATGRSFNMDLIQYSQLNLYLLGVFLVAGLLIGVCGSVMAIRKFLKV